jgi:hypothetical protein
MQAEFLIINYEAGFPVARDLRLRPEIENLQMQRTLRKTHAGVDVPERVAVATVTFIPLLKRINKTCYHV